MPVGAGSACSIRPAVRRTRATGSARIVRGYMQHRRTAHGPVPGSTAAEPIRRVLRHRRGGVRRPTPAPRAAHRRGRARADRLLQPLPALGVISGAVLVLLLAVAFLAPVSGSSSPRSPPRWRGHGIFRRSGRPRPAADEVLGIVDVPGPLSVLTPIFTVGDQITEAPLIHGTVSRRQAGARAVELLELVGIPKRGTADKGVPARALRRDAVPRLIAMQPRAATPPAVPRSGRGRPAGASSSDPRTATGREVDAAGGVHRQGGGTRAVLRGFERHRCGSPTRGVHPARS